MDLAALKAAVLDAATEGWRAASGRDMTAEDRANFSDPDQPAEELEAERVSELLKDALTEAANFDRSARGATPAERTARSQAPRSPIAGGVLAFIDRFLPFLVEPERATVDGRPAVLAALPGSAEGWRVKMRRRVVALLTDHLEYWRNLGLREPASYFTMACASILLGEFPQIHPRAFREEGVTVAEVMEKEMAAIRAAVSNHEKALD
jgi:hypothetical protein